MADWDLLVVTPSRGRPAGLRRLIAAIAARSQTGVLLAVGLDDDDPALDDYLAILYPPHDADLLPAVRNMVIEVAPRMTMGAWTNRLVAALDGQAPFVASLGDDHEPMTDGWDRLLIAGAISRRPLGIAYGNDLLQGEALPTAPVMSAQIPAALGWMCPPGMTHFYVDNVWRDLGNRCGCLVYQPDVIIAHHHPAGAGGARGFLWDQTYEDAQPAWSSGIDHAAYQDWAGGHADDDCRKINEAITKAGAR